MAGRYDDVAEELVKRFGAKGVLVLVIEGQPKGTGMSFAQRQNVEFDVTIDKTLVNALPAMLRGIADKMEATPLPEPEIKVMGNGGVN